jgi:hypothetical protein
MTKEAILGAQHYPLDHNLVKSFERKKLDEVISGSILTAFLYKTVSSTYEKKMVLNWSQLQTLRQVNTKRTRTKYYYESNNHCFAFTHNDDTPFSETLTKAGERVVKPSTLIQSPKLEYLYLNGYITFYNSCFEETDTEVASYCSLLRLKSSAASLPKCRPIRFESLTTLSADEKRIYNIVLKNTISELCPCCETVWHYRGSEFVTQDIKRLSEPLKLLKTEVEEYQQIDNEDNLSSLIYRNYVKKCPGGGYALDSIGEIVVKLLKDVNHIDQVQNLPLDKYEVKTEDGRYIVGKYGLVFQKTNGEFVKSGGGGGNSFGYFKGQRVQLRAGKYGAYAIIGDNNKTVSLKSITGNRPIENIKWGEVYNYLLKKL